MRGTRPCLDRWKNGRGVTPVKLAMALAAFVLVGLAALPDDANAQEASSNLERPQDAGASSVANADQPTISASIPALGDFKKALLDRGVDFELDYIQDTFGNPTGGVKQGATYDSALYMLVDADLAKLAGLTGATFRVNAFQIQGRGLSLYNVYNYSTISSAEAVPTTRLFELWVEQKLFADLASVRVGQLAADNQFFLSEFGNNLYVNGTFGWPTIFAANLPSGGPGYPMATPGARVKLTPNDHITLLAAIFNGDPAGSGFTGMQEIKDPAGVNFRLKDPPLLFGEAQLAYNQDKTVGGLAGTIKLGAWYHFGLFYDNHFGFDGRSLADPLSSGAPLVHSGDYGVYGVIDQMLWRLPGNDPKKGVAAFIRMTGSPSDRNLMDLYAEAGVNFMGLWRERPDDSFGCAAAFSRLSPSVGAFDRDSAFFSGEVSSIRDYELALELTYQATIVRGWTVQPDFQYIIHPGGGVIDPVTPSVGRIPDAAVFGLRTTITF